MKLSLSLEGQTHLPKEVEEFEGDNLELKGCDSLVDISLLTDKSKLRRLSISAGRKPTLPTQIFRSLKRLDTLEHLDLHGCYDLEDFSFLSNLKNIRSLRLIFVNKLVELSAFTNLKSLQLLYLTDCYNITNITPISDLNTLESLHLSGIFQVSDLSALSYMKSLKFLYLSEAAQVSDLSSLYCVKSLESLHLSDAIHVSDLSPLSGLKSLESLHLHFCEKISDLSPLSKLKSLESLHLNNCEQVSDLSPLSSLKSLESLHLNNCEQVSDLSPLPGLKSLESFTLTNCEQVSDLSPLSRLKSLESLHIGVCKQVNDLSPLSTLKSLESLYLAFCSKVTSISALYNLESLKVLYLGHCEQVTDLSPLSGLRHLEALHINGSGQAVNLSPLASITALKYLELMQTGGYLSCIPEVSPLTNLIKLDTLIVDTIAGAPPQLGSKDHDDNALPRIRQWQQSLQDSGTARERGIKVFILGNGHVGKTQLRRRLSGQTYDESIPSTHGIEVEDIVGELYDESDNPLSFKFWDFGGQDIYLGTHAMFLDDRAIFLIAWNPDYEDIEEFTENGITLRNRPLNYWLEYVRNHTGPHTPVILVQTQCEKHAQRREPSVLPDHGFAWLDRTHSSAKRDDGIDSIKNCLVSAANYLLESYGDVLLPNSWVALSKELQDRRKQKLLPLKDFKQLCSDLADVDISTTLLEYFHRNGEIFWQQDAFNDQLVLDFSWCFNGIYAIFHREKVLPFLLERQGQFTLELLAQTVWLEYNHSEQELFLSIMRQCGMCFKLADNTYIAPHALPPYNQDKVSQIWNQVSNECVAVMRFPFLSEGVVREMITILGEKAKTHGCYWAYGCSFYDAKTQAKALITTTLSCLDHNETSGEIRIATCGGQAQVLAEYLVNSLNRITPLKVPTVEWEGNNNGQPKHLLGHEGIKAAYSKDESPSENKPFALITPTAPPGSTAPITNIFHIHQPEEVNNFMSEQQNTSVNVGRDMNASAVGHSIQSFSVGQFSIGETPAERDTQIQSLQALITLLKETDGLEESIQKKSLRHLENAEEALNEANPDAGQVASYLNKASAFMDNIEQGSDLFNRASTLFQSLGSVVAGVVS